MTPAPPVTSGSARSCSRAATQSATPCGKSKRRHQPDRGLQPGLVVAGLPVALQPPEHVGRGRRRSRGRRGARPPRGCTGPTPKISWNSRMPGPVTRRREPDVQVEGVVADGDGVGAGRVWRRRWPWRRTVPCPGAAGGLRLRPAAGGHRPDADRAGATPPASSSTRGPGRAPGAPPRARPARPPAPRRPRRGQRDPGHPRPPARAAGHRRRRRGAAASSRPRDGTWQALVRPSAKLRDGEVLAHADGTPLVEVGRRAGDPARRAPARRPRPSSSGTARCRCRPTSPRRSPTPSATRPSTPAGRARWRRRPPGSTSRPRCSPAWPSAASPSRRSSSSSGSTRSSP